MGLWGCSTHSLTHVPTCSSRDGCLTGCLTDSPTTHFVSPTHRLTVSHRLTALLGWGWCSLAVRLHFGRQPALQVWVQLQVRLADDWARAGIFPRAARRVSQAYGLAARRPDGDGRLPSPWPGVVRPLHVRAQHRRLGVHARDAGVCIAHVHAQIAHVHAHIAHVHAQIAHVHAHAHARVSCTCACACAMSHLAARGLTLG